MIEGADIEADEGFHLVLLGDFTDPVERYLAVDDGRLVLRIGQDAVFELLAAAKRELEPWVNDFEHYRSLHAGERRGIIRVVPSVDDDCGYDLDDPKHPGWSNLVADAADIARKRAKGE